MKDAEAGVLSEIELLANFIMQEVPNEPSRNEGAGECAIRIIKALRARLKTAEAAVLGTQRVIKVQQTIIDAKPRQPLDKYRALVEAGKNVISALEFDGGVPHIVSSRSTNHTFVRLEAALDAIEKEQP
jgi:hypothetical protein